MQYAASAAQAEKLTRAQLAEENAQINVAVALSGMTKQDYITNKLLNREIVVRGNCKIHKAIFDQLTAVLNELQRIENSTDVSDETHDNIRLITSVIEKLYVPEI